MDKLPCFHISDEAMPNRAGARRADAERRPGAMI